MNEVIDNVLVGDLNGTIVSGVTQVSGQAGKGIFLSDDASKVDYGTHQFNCFYDPDICSQGVTFAIWIKRDQGATGYLLDTGGNHKRANGNQQFYNNNRIYNHIHITTST